jgi:hypothetical protein
MFSSVLFPSLLVILYVIISNFGQKKIIPVNEFRQGTYTFKEQWNFIINFQL